MNAEAGEKVASSSSGIKFIKTNVTVLDEWRKLVLETQKAFGKIDILINNAGTSYPNKATMEVTEAEFDKCFNVNVKSIYFSVKTVVQVMIGQGTGGSIVNVASIGVLRPRPGLVWYNASKGAVSNATKGLGAEFARHQIRFNDIFPLLSATGLWETFTGTPDTPENRAKFVGAVPLGRLTDPLDIANAALYFASDESSFVTGASLEVDGGRGIA